MTDMIDIALKYDPESGQLVTPDGITITTYLGLEMYEIKEAEEAVPAELSVVSSSIDDLIRLKDAGFTAEEIISLQARLMLGSDGD